VIADLTYYFHWSPDAAWNLTFTELRWWNGQMHRIAAGIAASREE
jgi:hypothetical protein